MKKVLCILFAVILLLSGIAHAVVPDEYAPMIPEFMPLLLANYMAAIAELAIAVALIWPKYRIWGGLGFMGLMIAFLPIHIWDMLKESPAIGPHPIPVIRLVFQLVLIYAGFWLYQSYKNEGASKS